MPTLRSTFTIIAAIINLALPVFPAASGDIKPPSEFLGFEVGADRKLADWKDISAYFGRVAEQSPRVELQVLGKSTQDRDLIMAVISAPENLSGLDEIRKVQSRLANPDGLSEAEADKLIARGKTVVMISCSIHSTEIGGSQMALRLLHHLASDDSPGTVEILENVILLLLPSPNPDGIQLVVDWYKKYLGTDYEGTPPVQLYHKYTGHDNNRDWFMLTQQETRLVSRVLYRDWFPQILYDVHQMGSHGPRFVVPPFYPIANPNIDPIILRSLLLVGGHITSEMTAAGLKGVATRTIFDMWWHGGMRTAPYYHNIVGILSEAASVKIATPLEVDKSKLRGSNKGLPKLDRPSVNYPDPWPGGKWTIRDIIEYDFTAARAVLRVAARYRDMWLRNFYLLGKQAIKAGKEEAPYAYLISPDQHDPAAAAELLRILHLQGTRIQRAKKKFTADGHEYPKGTYLISLDQPYRANIKALMERQEYPQWEVDNGSAQPYDVAGWTLPLQMGVRCLAVQQPYQGKFEGVAEIDWPVKPKRGGKPEWGMALRPGSSGAYGALNELWDRDISVLRTTKACEHDGMALPAGTFLIPTARNADVRRLVNLIEEHQAGWLPLTTKPKDPASDLCRPRLGVYQSWVAAMDEGWSRWVLERFGFAYHTLHDAEVRRGCLRRDFDAIILPDQLDSTIIRGLSSRGGYYRFPPEYTGGMGEIGVRNLREFVEQGGVLIALDSACELPVRSFYLPVRNEAAGLKRDVFNIPGSLLRIIVDPANPLGYGMPREAVAVFARSPILSGAGEVAARYPLRDPLLSGYALGENRLLGEAAAQVVPLGEGKVVLFGFRVQHRAQSWGTFKMLFNAILMGGMN